MASRQEILKRWWRKWRRLLRFMLLTTLTLEVYILSLLAMVPYTAAQTFALFKVSSYLNLPIFRCDRVHRWLVQVWQSFDQVRKLLRPEIELHSESRCCVPYCQTTQRVHWTPETKGWSCRRHPEINIVPLPVKLYFASPLPLFFLFAFSIMTDLDWIWWSGSRKGCHVQL